MDNEISLDANTATRADVAQLLKQIGKPGEKQEEKIQAVKELNQKNIQNIPLEETLDSYPEF